MIEVVQSFHRGDARRFQLLDLSTADIGHVEKAVLCLLDNVTMIGPTAQTAQGIGRVDLGAATKPSIRARAIRA